VPPKIRTGLMMVASAVLIIMAKGSRIIRSQRMATIGLSKIVPFITLLVEFKILPYSRLVNKKSGQRQMVFYPSCEGQSPV